MFSNWTRDQNQKSSRFIGLSCGNGGETGVEVETPRKRGELQKSLVYTRKSWGYLRSVLRLLRLERLRRQFYILY